jgi:hypothetical protein
LVAMVAAQMFALRRVRGGSGRWIYLGLAPAALPIVIAFWPEADEWSRSPLLATVDLLVGVVTLSLLVLLARKIETTPVSDFLAKPPRELFDFFVWAALGAPLVLGALLLVMLVSGQLTKSP